MLFHCRLTVAIVAVITSAQSVDAQLTEGQQRGVDASVARALDYISREQQPGGAWRTDSSGESTAATSLAVMAFMSAGHVPGEGPYGRKIESGIRWVIEHQEENGMLVHRRSHGPMPGGGR